LKFLPKLCGEKLVILPSQNKRARGEANLQYASNQQSSHDNKERADDKQIC
jgi:hypothetical protein